MRRPVAGLASSVMGIAPMTGAAAATLVRRFVTSPAPTAETFRRGAHLAALDRLVRVRILFAPVIAAVALTFAFFEPTPWRRAAIGVAVTWVMTLSIVEWVRARRHGILAVSLPFNFFGLLAAQLTLIASSGGLLSPLIPVLIVMAVIGGLVVEAPTIRFVPLVVAPSLFLMAWVHARYGLLPVMYGDAGALEAGVLPWLGATLWSSMVTGATFLGGVLSGVLGRLFADAVDERDRRLAGYAEQMGALSALSAEIAHELKNPLASVKGLGALVAKDVEGKPAERIAVLRREVDRMQGILDELLNFSRPLVPLAMEEVDAGALAEDVVRMHEGSAADCGVRLAVEAHQATLTCDPRKVRQVLVNLVQNALHASPRGGEVIITVAGEGEDVVFLVDDRGPGLAEAVRGRLFEAGVTSKEDGSGIGLVVARSLARQHGGELTLEDRDGGGCRAALRLPRRPKEIAA